VQPLNREATIRLRSSRAIHLRLPGIHHSPDILRELIHPSNLGIPLHLQDILPSQVTRHLNQAIHLHLPATHHSPDILRELIHPHNRDIPLPLPATRLNIPAEASRLQTAEAVRAC
jgi:hypothetical protein